MQNLSSPRRIGNWALRAIKFDWGLVKNLKKIGIITTFLSVLLAFPVQAANLLDMVINEIAWMGTENSSYDEWIELYNNTDLVINLEGWIIKATDGTPEISLVGTISTKGFYLLERTDDNTVPTIFADQIYKGALENNGENIELYDNYGNLIDSIDCSSGWFMGDNKTKQTMERKNSESSGNNPDNWVSSQNSGGTPKAKNSEQETVNNKQLTPIEGGPLSTKSREGHITYSSGVFINEILPSPEGPHAQEEWIEIRNQNNFKVSLSGWQIKDAMGSTTNFTLPEGTEILAKDFLILSRPTTKITLNNDGDELSLIQPDGKIIDTVTFEKAPRGKSYNRTESGWVWSTILTPKAENIISAPSLTKEEIESSKEGIKEIDAEKELAAIGQQISEPSKPFSVFLIAFALAIFSGVIILILKKKLKSKVEI